MIEQIIPPVDPDELERELTPARRLRRTNKSDNEIYVVTGAEAPQVMREIGRLREAAFRYYGGGTGRALDVDTFDSRPGAYRQLIVWSPKDRRILGGYRFRCGSEALDTDGEPALATAALFYFSDRFIREYLPYTVELGRSFVSLDYQATLPRPGSIFILDNLWDGLGALTVIDPTLRYFFGKVTMYPGYNVEARNMILYFLRRHFPDPDRLVEPIHPLTVDVDEAAMEALFRHGSFRENYRVLNQEVRKRGLNIPPLVNAYMSLSPQMRTFGTAINRRFGNVEETGLLIAIDEILEEKKKRHIETYLKEEAETPAFRRVEIR